MFGGEGIIKSHRARANAIGHIIVTAFLIILTRLWYLQVYKGKLLYNYSLKNRLRSEVVLAPRGMIFSRNNSLIVDNIPRFDAALTPQYLQDKSITIKKLGVILGMSEESIYKIIAKNSGMARYRPVIIKKNISWREVAVIETENAELPGISVETFISREYADKEISSHLLGYIAEISPTQLPKYQKRDKYDYKIGDFIGQFGLEEEHDLVLRGTNGHEFVEVDASGRKKRHINTDKLFKGIKNRPSIPGLNIRLTIDRDMQLSAYHALEGKVGSAVAVDVETGEILTMISRPGFDPSLFSKGINNEDWNALIQNEKNPLRDRTIQEHYSPGSTFKVFSAIAALEEGIVDENSEVICSGKFRLGRRDFHCWKKAGHGKVNVVKAIRESCDVFFYRIALKMDIDVLAKYAKMFGMGKKSGINLPREVSGLIPTREWKKKKNGQDWALGETLSCIIGQSYVLTSPLQLAMAISTLGNGGRLYRPMVVKEIFSNAGKVRKKFAPELVSELNISPKTLAIVSKGLYEVVNTRKGTAWWYRGKGISMAGKTGTSQVIRLSADKIFNKCEETEYKYRHHGVFVALIPSDKPKIAVGVVVEHGCHGSSAATPVAAEIGMTYMKKYHPELHEHYLSVDKQLMKSVMVENAQE